jgi:hypothetical protein
MLTPPPFDEVRAGKPEWSQLSGFKHRCSLHQDDRTYAVLAWQGAFGTLTLATTAGWSFRNDPRSPLLACLLWSFAVMASHDEAAVVTATG